MSPEVLTFLYDRLSKCSLNAPPALTIARTLVDELQIDTVNPIPRDECLRLPERTKVIKTWLGLSERIIRLDDRQIQVAVDRVGQLTIILRSFSHSDSEYAFMLDTANTKVDIALKRLFD